MNFRNSRFPIVKLPLEIQTCLYLIKEELKSRKFFRTFQALGLDDCYFQPHLDILILRSLDMDDGTDETFEAYSKIIECRSQKIDTNNDSIMKQALKVYHELLEKRKKIMAASKESKRV